jgi:hypothetical protein
MLKKPTIFNYRNCFTKINQAIQSFTKWNYNHVYKMLKTRIFVYIWPVNLYFKCIKLVISDVKFLKRADAKETNHFRRGRNRILHKHVYNTNNKILEIVSRKLTRQSSLLQNGIKIMFIKCQ